MRRDKKILASVMRNIFRKNPVKIIAALFFVFAASAPAVGKNVYVGIRVSFRITKEQLSFINRNFDYVITPFLKHKIRREVKGPKLLLYRSIRGSWEGFSQFDWDHIDACENMFLHHEGQRIKTIYNSFLMNGEDLVDADSADALNHWINYYAVVSSRQVHDFDYDGLFIDSAGHRLSRGEVRGIMPDNYSPPAWREFRYKGLRFIKKYFPDKLVIFNGLHSGNGAERSLEFTDGGMWETFAFNVKTGQYTGKDKWKEAVELARKYGKRKFISLVSKRRGFTEDVNKRLFVFASYLLVSSPKVILYISDLSYGTRCILYYPEYQIDLGRPLGDYFKKNGLYVRRFSKGLVLVNPDEFRSYRFPPGENYYRLVPSGGGKVEEDGYWQGRINYKKVNGAITVPPLSGVILKYNAI